MKIVWKLLRHHLSGGQLTGFFLANLVGLIIVLLGIQLYCDVLPLMAGRDSLLKKEYIVVGKRITALGGLVRQSHTFSTEEIEELRRQSFAQSVGLFTPSRFKVTAGVGMEQAGIRLSTEMFFEAVPDEFIDTDTHQWDFQEEEGVIPIILPRSYLSLYNFGFAQNRRLPKLSEGVLGMIRMEVTLRGAGQTAQYRGRIAGFSNRLNTILVPQKFIDWANRTFAPGERIEPARLIIEVKNPADPALQAYFKAKGYEAEGGAQDAGKVSYLLRVAAGVVTGIGGLISLLAFYVLLLSVFLLLQKNSTKLENLLLIGYSPAQVARPYYRLTLSLSLCVLLLAEGVVCAMRMVYMARLRELFPTLEGGTLWISLAAGVVIFFVSSLINMICIHRKVQSLFSQQ